jgi:replicative DNA helicase
LRASGAGGGSLGFKASLLACLLIGCPQQEQDHILQRLRPGLFYMVKHQEILLAMFRLREEGYVLDAIALSEKLKVTGKLEEAGGFVSLSELLNFDSVSSYLQWNDYITLLEEFWLRRLALQKRERLTELAHGERLTVADFQNAFSELSERAGARGATPGR